MEEGLDWSEERALFEELGEFYYSEDVDNVCDCDVNNDELLKMKCECGGELYRHCKHEDEDGFCEYYGEYCDLIEDCTAFEPSGYYKCEKCGKLWIVFEEVDSDG